MKQDPSETQGFCSCSMTAWTEKQVSCGRYKIHAPNYLTTHRSATFCRNGERSFSSTLSAPASLYSHKGNGTSSLNPDLRDFCSA